MSLRLLCKTSRSISIEYITNEIVFTKEYYNIYINNKLYKKTNKIVNTIYNLMPNTDYLIKIIYQNETHEILVKTNTESFSINIKNFGAKGNGIDDDTAFIQAAIMSCPDNGHVLIPAGKYKVSTLFLKSNISLEISANAILSGIINKTQLPILPGTLQSDSNELLLASWEGESISSYSSILVGINVNNINIYGEGFIDGNATFDNWWKNPKNIEIAARPRMIYLNHCSNISLIGLSIQNSPSWNIHPFFSQNLKFINLNITSPQNSPNTDGLNPESCNNVSILGCYFSVGDDCIAIKSGKISIGKKYHTPSQNIIIKHCFMHNGHGSITLGSEMSGGIKDIFASQCIFSHTDRGLRIKTRRGRGNFAIIDNISFNDLKMDSVLTPFSINCFYFCDSDGHSEYVQTKKALPVDDRTPSIKKLKFSNIDIKNCHICAAFFYGLPENKIESIEMNSISINYDKNPTAGTPDMLDDISDNISKMGIYAKNINYLKLEKVSISNQNGAPLIYSNINNLVTSIK